MAENRDCAGNVGLCSRKQSGLELFSAPILSHKISAEGAEIGKLLTRLHRRPRQFRLVSRQLTADMAQCKSVSLGKVSLSKHARVTLSVSLSCRGKRWLIVFVRLKALEHAEHLLGGAAVSAVGHQFGVAQDGVQWRAQLVAHIGR
jgi:hypothetical protein